MIKFWNNILLAFILIGTISCSHKAIVPHIDFITNADNGKTIQIEKGGIIEIDLRNDTLSDKSWHIANDIPSAITMLGKPRKRVYTDSLGSAGMTTFSFRATQVQEGVLLQLEFGDPKAAAKKSFNVTLNIHESKAFFEEEEEEPGIISKTIDKINFFSDEEGKEEDNKEEKKGETEDNEEPGLMKRTFNKLNPFSK